MRASLTRTILATSVLALSVAAASASAQSLMATPEEQRAYDDAREQKTVPKWLRDHGRECDELTKIYRAPTQGYLAAFDYQCSNGTIYKLGIVAGAEGQLVFRTDDDTKASRPEVR